MKRPIIPKAAIQRARGVGNCEIGSGDAHDITYKRLHSSI